MEDVLTNDVGQLFRLKGYTGLLFENVCQRKKGVGTHSSLLVTKPNSKRKLL